MDLFWGDDGRLRSGWRVVLSVVVYVVVNEFAVSIANAYAGPSDRKFELLYRPLLMLVVIGAFSILLKVADRAPGNPLPAMGLGRTYLAQDAVLGMGLGALMICVALASVAVAFHLAFRVLISRHTLEMALAVVLIFATGAMAEEATFRGYPFQILVQGAGATTAIFLTSVCFGLLHLKNPNASVFGTINTVAIGIVLAISYLRTRSLWLPWGLHFGWNLTLGLLFGLPVSGLPQFGVVVRGSLSGPKWLTGGAYGIEGGAAGTLAIVVGLVLVLMLVRRRPAPDWRQIEENGFNSSEAAGIQPKQESSAAG